MKLDRYKSTFPFSVEGSIKKIYERFEHLSEMVVLDRSNAP